MLFNQIIFKVLEKWLEAVCFESVILKQTELKKFTLLILLHTGGSLSTFTSCGSLASFNCKKGNDHLDYFSMYKNLNFINS